MRMNQRASDASSWPQAQVEVERNVKAYTASGAATSRNVSVAVRVRPLDAREVASGSASVIGVVGNSVTLVDPVCLEVTASGTTGGLPFMLPRRQFSFDHVYHRAHQANLYAEVGRPLAEHAWNGFNTCLFAYGQTGSGKSYTILGSSGVLDPSTVGDHEGLLPRLCKDIFGRIDVARSAEHAHASREDELCDNEGEDGGSTGARAEWSVTVSYYEIYCERVRDLFAVEHAAAALSSPGPSGPGKVGHAHDASNWGGAEGGDARSVSHSVGSGKGGRGPASVAGSRLGPAALGSIGSRLPSSSSPTPPPATLRVREHPTAGAYVEGLRHVQVRSYEEVEKLLVAGSFTRTVAETRMNESSSRSHAVFTLSLTSSQRDAATGVPLHTRTSRAVVVDLAGSERGDTLAAYKAAHAVNTGAGSMGLSDGADSELALRHREMSKINTSLSALGAVIKALAARSEREHRDSQAQERGRGASKASGGVATGSGDFVPYRNSVLTWLLRDCLGGNSVTTMVATVSPSDGCYSETLSTLKYADAVKRIVHHAKANAAAAPEGMARLVTELQEEVKALRAALQAEQAARKGAGPANIGGTVEVVPITPRMWGAAGVGPGPCNANGSATMAGSRFMRGSAAGRGMEAIAQAAAMGLLSPQARSKLLPVLSTASAEALAAASGDSYALCAGREGRGGEQAEMESGMGLPDRLYEAACDAMAKSGLHRPVTLTASRMGAGPHSSSSLAASYVSGGWDGAVTTLGRGMGSPGRQHTMHSTDQPDAALSPSALEGWGERERYGPSASSLRTPGAGNQGVGHRQSGLAATRVLSPTAVDPMRLLENQLRHRERLLARLTGTGSGAAHVDAAQLVPLAEQVGLQPSVASVLAGRATGAVSARSPVPPPPSFQVSVASLIKRHRPVDEAQGGDAPGNISALSAGSAASGLVLTLDELEQAAAQPRPQLFAISQGMQQGALAGSQRNPGLAYPSPAASHAGPTPTTAPRRAFSGAATQAGEAQQDEAAFAAVAQAVAAAAARATAAEAGEAAAGAELVVREQGIIGREATIASLKAQLSRQLEATAKAETALSNAESGKAALRRELRGAEDALAAAEGTVTKMQSRNGSLAEDCSVLKREREDLLLSIRTRAEQAASALGEAAKAKSYADGLSEQLSRAREQLAVARMESDTARTELARVRTDAESMHDSRLHSLTSLVGSLQAQLTSARAEADGLRRQFEVANRTAESALAESAAFRSEAADLAEELGDERARVAGSRQAAAGVRAAVERERGEWEATAASARREVEGLRAALEDAERRAATSAAAASQASTNAAVACSERDAARHEAEVLHRDLGEAAARLDSAREETGRADSEARRARTELASILTAADMELKRFARVAEDASSARVASEIEKVRRECAHAVESAVLSKDSALAEAAAAAARALHVEGKAAALDTAQAKAAAAEGQLGALRSRVAESESECRRMRSDVGALRSRADEAEGRAMAAATAASEAQSDAAASSARLSQAQEDWSTERARTQQAAASLAADLTSARDAVIAAKSAAVGLQRDCEAARAEAAAARVESSSHLRACAETSARADAAMVDASAAREQCMAALSAMDGALTGQAAERDRADSLAVQLAALTTSHARDVADVRMAHERELEEVRAGQDRALASLRGAMAASSESRVHDLQRQLEDARAGAAREISSLQESLSSRVMAIQMRLMQCQSDLACARDQAATAEQACQAMEGDLSSSRAEVVRLSSEFTSLRYTLSALHREREANVLDMERMQEKMQEECRAVSMAEQAAARLHFDSTQRSWDEERIALTSAAAAAGARAARMQRQLLALAEAAQGSLRQGQRLEQREEWEGRYSGSDTSTPSPPPPPPPTSAGLVLSSIDTNQLQHAYAGINVPASDKSSLDSSVIGIPFKDMRSQDEVEGGNARDSKQEQEEGEEEEGEEDVGIEPHIHAPGTLRDGLSLVVLEGSGNGVDDLAPYMSLTSPTPMLHRSGGERPASRASSARSGRSTASASSRVALAALHGEIGRIRRDSQAALAEAQAALAAVQQRVPSQKGSRASTPSPTFTPAHIAGAMDRLSAAEAALSDRAEAVAAEADRVREDLRAQQGPRVGESEGDAGLRMAQPSARRPPPTVPTPSAGLTPRAASADLRAATAMARLHALRERGASRAE